MHITRQWRDEAVFVNNAYCITKIYLVLFWTLLLSEDVIYIIDQQVY